MAVLFHGSFALNREYMSGILDASIKDRTATDRSLATPYGYGEPFGQRYRSWLHKCGVTEMGLPMQLTPMGEVIRKKDREFRALTTQWILHHELVTDPERAEAWHFFANEFLPKHAKFTQADLIDGLTKKLRYHSEQHFGPGSKLNQQSARKIVQVYTEESALGQLGVLKKDGKEFVRLRAKRLGPWKTPEQRVLSVSLREPFLESR